MKQYLDAAENAARAAGKLLRENFQQQQRVKTVAAHDIKLEIDVRAQELIGKLLLEQFPAHALYGEEGIAGDQSSDHQWIVDPLDGTVNYFYGIPHFCVSIALRLHNEIVVGVIYDPVRNEVWTGQRGEVSKLNGAPIHVSDRAELAEAVISIGLAKTGETINTNFPRLQQMIHRVRKCRVLGSAALDVGQVERRATKYAAFTDAMNHLLKPGEIRVDRLSSFGQTDGDNGFRELGAIAHMDWSSIQFRNLASLPGPDLVANRIVNHANDDFVVQTQGDGNAKMRNAVEIIHRSIQRIDNPLMIAGLISRDSFFAVERVRGKLFEKQFANQLLRPNIDLQFDVMRCDGLNALLLLKIFA